MSATTSSSLPHPFAPRRPAAPGWLARLSRTRGAPAEAAAAAQRPAPARTASTDLWPLVAQAAAEGLCELRGAPPAGPLAVLAAEADLRALLAHLAAIVRHALGTECRPHAAGSVQGTQAVLHLAVPDADAATAGGEPLLAARFARMASASAPASAADRALHGSVHAALAIVVACGGRLYAAPSPLARMGLTLRLPLRTGGAVPPAALPEAAA